MKESNPLDHIEPRGHDPGYDGRASRVAGGERFTASVSRAKPLHWTRILAIAGVVGAVVGGVLGAILTSTSDSVVAAMFGTIVGAVVGLVVATVLERRGVFLRVDDL